MEIQEARQNPRRRFEGNHKKAHDLACLSAAVINVTAKSSFGRKGLFHQVWLITEGGRRGSSRRGPGGRNRSRSVEGAAYWRVLSSFLSYLSSTVQVHPPKTATTSRGIGPFISNQENTRLEKPSSERLVRVGQGLPKHYRPLLLHLVSQQRWDISPLLTHALQT